MSGVSAFESAAIFLIACSLKATFLLGAAWLIVRAMHGVSAAFRHTVWAVAILGTLALPLLALLMPTWHSTVLGNAVAVWGSGHGIIAGANAGNAPATVVDAVLTGPATGRWAEIFLMAWGVGVCIFAVRFGAGLVGLRRMAARSLSLNERDWEGIATEIWRGLGTRREVRFLQSTQETAMPVTWGTLRPVFLVPASAANWPEARKRGVLSHELAHIERMDWLFQVFAEIARAVYWFHPLAWMAAGCLRMESECACDDSVLNSGIDAAHYAKDLLELARTLENRSRSWSAALAIARPTNLERRFSAMLNPLIDRRKLSRRTRALAALIALFVLLPLAAVRLPAQDTGGKFGGIISDPSGMPVANATVIMDNHKGDGVHRIQMTTSDAEGKYGFVGLPAGEYEVRVTKPGFAEFQARISSLDSGHDSPHNDIALQIGGVNEEIDVIADGGPREGTKQGAQGGVAGGVAGGGASNGSAKTIRLRIGGEAQAPKIIEKVQPVYPEKAKAAGIDGTVILHAIISKDGNPLSLRVMNNQIDPELARAAVEAVSKWRYRPTLLNGEPVEVDTTIMVNFTLRP